MKFHIDKKYVKLGITSFLVIAASICFYYLVFHGDRFSVQLNEIAKVISPVLYGIIIAYLLTPLVNSIEKILLEPMFLKLKKDKPITSKSKKHMRVIAILLTMFIVIIVIYGFFLILIPNIVKSVKSISYQFPYYIQNLMKWSAKFLDDNPEIEKVVFGFFDGYSEKLSDFLNHSIIPQMEAILRQLSLSMISLLKGLWNFIIGFIISIYVLYNKENFAAQAKKLIFAFFNIHTANQLIKDVRFTSDTFIGFISGKILDSAIIGCICFAGTSIMKTPYALLVSVIVGVTNVIPFFGPYLGAIPSAILILMVNPVKCIYFIIFIVILQQIDGNVIGPKILGGSTGLSGFWVIFSITVFGGIMGIPGMIIGVPFFAVFYALVRRFTNRLLRKRGLPTETEKYLNVDYIDGKDIFVPRGDSEKQKSFFRLKKNRANTLKSPNVASENSNSVQNKIEAESEEIEKKESSSEL